MVSKRKVAPATSEAQLLNDIDALLALRYAPAAVVTDERHNVRLFRGKTGLYLEHAPGEASQNLLTMVRSGILETVTRGLQKARACGYAAAEPVWIEDDSGGYALVSVDTHCVTVATSPQERLFCIVFRTLARRTQRDVQSSILPMVRLGADAEALRAELARSTVAEQTALERVRALQSENALLREEARKAYEEAEGDKRALAGELRSAHEQMVLSTAIWESVGEGVIVTDTGGVISHVNPAYLALVQKEREELVGSPIHEVLRLSFASHEPIPLAERPYVQALLRAQGGAHDPVETFALLERSDGKEVSVAVLSRAIEVEGKITGTVSTFRDLTSIEAAEQAKAEFISLASHQLRTPLSVIALNLELLERDGEADRMSSESRKSLETMQRAARRMVELMNILLSLARVESGSLVPSLAKVRLGKLLKEVVEQQRPFAHEKKVRIETKCDATIKLTSDPQFLHMILQNLISNGVKYCRQGGHVRCSVSRTSETVTIAVRDDGIGIPKSDRDKIFSRLFRADNAVRSHAEGTGLGLYLVHALVTKLGGEITFTSKVHEGTTFYVKLPVDAVAEEGT